jgi:hypothetical protein
MATLTKHPANPGQRREGMFMPTTELKTAYQRAGLWRQGKSFAECMAQPVVRDILQRCAAAQRRLMQRRGEQVPAQKEIAL